MLLIHEKDNPDDPQAVAFHLGSSHHGYIPRRRNRTIATLLDKGVPLCAWISKVNPDAGRWAAVEVAVFVTDGNAVAGWGPAASKAPIVREL